jgi:hypothetical protein
LGRSKLGIADFSPPLSKMSQTHFASSGRELRRADQRQSVAYRLSTYLQIWKLMYLIARF